MVSSTTNVPQPRSVATSDNIRRFAFSSAPRNDIRRFAPHGLLAYNILSRFARSRVRDLVSSTKKGARDVFILNLTALARLCFNARSAHPPQFSSLRHRHRCELFDVGD